MGKVSISIWSNNMFLGKMKQRQKRNASEYHVKTELKGILTLYFYGDVLCFKNVLHLWCENVIQTQTCFHQIVSGIAQHRIICHIGWNMEQRGHMFCCWRFISKLRAFLKSCCCNIKSEIISTKDKGYWNYS